MPLHNLPTLMEELQRPAFERTISWRRSHLDNGDMDGAAAARATPCISIEFQGHRTRQATGYQTHHTFRCCNTMTTTLGTNIMPEFLMMAAGAPFSAQIHG